MVKRPQEPAARPDEDNPAWTQAQMRRARPALQVIAEAFGTDAAVMLKRGRGRPAKPDRKVNQTLRLDADVLDAYRQSGPGWQTRINQVLRDHMDEATKQG